MEKTILKNSRTGVASKYEKDTLRKKGQKESKGRFGFNGVMGET